MIAKAILIYLLIGALYVLLEIGVILFGRKHNIVAKTPEKEHIYECIAFFIEIFIWPIQLTAFMYGFCKYFKMKREGKTEEEIERRMEE